MLRFFKSNNKIKIYYNLFILLIIILISLCFIFDDLLFSKIRNYYDHKRVTEVIEELESDDPEKRYKAIIFLGSCIQFSDEIGPHLVNYLHSDDVEARCLAIVSLGKLRYDPDNTIPMISDFLFINNNQVKKAAIMALGYYGDNAKPLLRELITLLQDKDAVIRFFAIISINSIADNRDKELVIPAYIEALNDSYLPIRLTATRRLTVYGIEGIEAKAAIPALILSLNDENSDVRGFAALAIKATGPHAKDAIDMINDKIKTENNPEKKNQLMEAIDIIEGRIKFE